MTPWAGEITPDNAWHSYPRPQMRRPDWLNLNGLWDYGIAPRKASQPLYEGLILVPYPLESALSGVKRGLKPKECLWYRRTFQVPESWEGQRVLLHFGAVDWEACVWVNGQQVGTHQGGYLPFNFDISSNLVPGENLLVVSVWDPSNRSWIGRGKQVLKPKSIWYTAVSGIWQTVWLEPVPQTYIHTIKLTPDIDAETLCVQVNLKGACDETRLVATASVQRETVGVVSGRSDEVLQIPILDPVLWSPDNPFLYDLEVEVFHQGKQVDRVETYFGMRKFSLGLDSRGRQRLCLNNQPLFQYGPLDQGYWPDGLYTPPNEDAMLYDLKFLQKIGCNMVRKHIKVEPARYYYDCDRMGLIVWQDMVNGGKAVGSVLSFLALMFSKLTRSDQRFYWRSGRCRRKSRQDFQRELVEMVDHLHNFACIGLWVPFNEGWGQFDARRVAAWLKAYDPTRPVDHASGWFDQGGGDLRSIHTYFKALKPEDPQQRRAVVLSEFGGYNLKLEGHVWDPDAEFGYRKFKTSQSLTQAYIDLLKKELKPWIRRGLSGAVYTQTSDVEIETNGYLTYDRQVEKMDPVRLALVHEDLLETAKEER